MTTKQSQRNLGREARSDGELKELHSVLVPVDLTPSSDRVLGRTARLPLAPNARITLLHVVPKGLSPSEQKRAERDAARALAEEVRHVRELLPRKVAVDRVVTVGAAAKDIAEQARRVDADLIVMGRGSGRVIRDAFLGSTAERVLREAQRPVLVVRLPARSPYHRPSLALDLEQPAEEMVRLMLLLLDESRPVVQAIHGFEFPYQSLVYPSLRDDDAVEHKDVMRAEATQKLNKLLAQALTKLGIPPSEGPVFKPHVRQGSPRMIVEKAVERAESDLLVLGTHAHTGAAYAFLGSVAGDLLRAAKCDVLVVPPAPPRE